ncbi:MAG: thioredoxin family protein [Ferrovibrio sp.]|nr:thioredoxin family protein [Ferrovibrio sp.]
MLALLPAVAAAEPRAALLLRYESEEQLLQLAKEGPTVLFFFAGWCPYCQEAARDFSTKWEEVKPGIALVVADYDKQTALKAKYGVTYQDTYVQIGADGKRLKIWNGGSIAGLNRNTIS